MARPVCKGFGEAGLEESWINTIEMKS